MRGLGSIVVRSASVLLPPLDVTMCDALVPWKTQLQMLVVDEMDCVHCNPLRTEDIMIRLNLGKKKGLTMSIYANEMVAV